MVRVAAHRRSGAESPFWLSLDLEDDSWRSANERLLETPFWTERAGILRSARGLGCVVYLEAQTGLADYFPSALTLDLEPGRYAVETWDCGRMARTGVEVATASPLVCGPPCSGDSLAVWVRPLSPSRP